MSLVSLLDTIGIERTRDTGGNEVAAWCPRHEQLTGQRERRPDHWSINRHTGLHHCFSCEYSGSLTSLIMDMTGIGPWEAKQLIRQHEVEVEASDRDIVDTERLARAMSIVLNGDLRRSYSTFTNPPERALERRRISLEVCERYGVRWDDDEGCWILPICHPRGTLWGSQKKYPDRVENYPTGVRKGLTLFGYHLLKPGLLTVLVESPLDVLVLAQHGYPAVSSFGAQHSHEQLRLIRTRSPRLLVAYDNDDQGKAATYELLRDQRITFDAVSVLNYDGCAYAKDPGEIRTRAETKSAIETAVPTQDWRRGYRPPRSEADDDYDLRIWHAVSQPIRFQRPWS
jgi:hypothetical protein